MGNSPGVSTHWLNRSTVAIALTSLFSDVCHELGTAVLPAVLLALGSGSGALGVIEGLSDAISAFSKLGGGVLTDRVKRRKPIATVGYFLTGIGMPMIAVASAWWQVLVFRGLAWIGRGCRGPARDVLMTEAAPPGAIGRAFGMERAGDALGAVIGPLLAMALIARGVIPRHVMLASAVPGVIAFLLFSVLVVERPSERSSKRRTMFGDIRVTGSEFQRYLVGVFVFGCGDFSRTMLIMYATTHLVGSVFSLGAASLAIGLYVLQNAVSTLAAFPIGVLADRLGRRRLIVVGYALAALVTGAFALVPSTPLWLAILFVGSGVYGACEDVCERAYAAAILPPQVRGTGLGILAATNGISAMIASALIGLVWAIAPRWTGAGFLLAAGLQLAGVLLIARPAPSPIN